MTGSPIGMAEYFSMEAGEYLDRLRTMLSGAEPPPADDFVRYSRALRGSALMANQQLVARVAAGLEAIAKGFREQKREWDGETSRRSRGAVDELSDLVRRVGNWSDGESQRAEKLALDLEVFTGIASPGRPRVTPSSNTGVGTADSGVRAFVAREGALAAGALDRAGRALRSAPTAHEPLYAVLRRLQTLRGLAALPDLTPLPDILDSVELAVGELTRSFAPPPGVDQVLDAAAQAISRAGRDVAQTGQPVADSPEARRFTDLLVRTFTAEEDVVPVEELFFEGEEGTVRRGLAPQQGPLGQLSSLELVSQGEHLCQAAAELLRAHTTIERDLRTFRLGISLRALEMAVGAEIPRALPVFAATARDLIVRGLIGDASEDFAARLREAGELLRAQAGPEGGSAALNEGLRRLARELRVLAGQSPDVLVSPPVPQAPEPDEEAEPPVVPIENLLLAEPDAAAAAETPGQPEEEAPQPAASQEARAAEPELEPSSLSRSIATLGRLLRERGRGPASLRELLAGGAGRPEPAIVAIEEICYRGISARERAAAVRRELEGILRAGTDLLRVRPLLDELVDLVDLAVGG